MNKQLPTVSVVIPTAGGRSHILDRSLRILLLDEATSEVIIVLTAKDAATEAIVQRYSRHDARVVPARTYVVSTSPATREQSGRDHGARAATSEVVLALDDDVEPRPGLVTGHARRHAGEDGLLVLGYMPVVPPRQRRGAARATARLYSHAYERACARFRANPDAVLLGLWGGNFSLRRAQWVSLESKDREPERHADREFGLRLRAEGLRGIFDPGLRAGHWYRRSALQLLDDAVSSGFSQASLKRTLPEIRPADPERPERLTVRPLLWASRSRMGWALTARGLVLLANAAALCRWSWLEYACVRALSRIGFHRGARMAGDH